VDNLLGVTIEQRNCSLFDVSLTDAGPSVFLEGGQILTRKKYRVGSLVLGVHLQSKAERVIDSATIRYEGLGSWLGSVVSRQLDDANSRYVISYPLKPVTIFNQGIAAIDSEVSLHHVFRSQNTRSECTVSAEPIITIEPHQPQSLSWFRDVANRLENFFSLVLGVSTTLKSMVITCGSQSGDFIGRRWSKAESAQHDRVIDCTPEQLYSTLERWFSVPDELRQVENLIYGTIRNSSLFVATEFLSLAQAIESFQRVTDKTLLMPTAEYKRVRRMLGKLFSRCFKAEPQILTRLKESIAHANEPAFRNRIKSLIARLSPRMQAAC
jgi:ApeA N-terminal domain 1